MSQTVARAFEILRYIAEAPRTLTEVGVQLEVHKSTALRLLQSLEHEGFAHQMADGRYTVGLAVIPLAQIATDRMDIRVSAHPHVRALAEHSGHTVHLAQLIGDHVIYVDKVDGSESLALGSHIGIAAERHTAAVAKAIIAQLPEARRDRILAQLTFDRYTATTITSAERYLQEIETVRKRGWAEDDGEKEPFIACVALPVHEVSGKTHIALSVTALSAVTPLSSLRENVSEYRQVALAISKDLGWKGHHNRDRR